MVKEEVSIDLMRAVCHHCLSQAECLQLSQDICPLLGVYGEMSWVMMSGERTS